MIDGPDITALFDRVEQLDAKCRDLELENAILRGQCQAFQLTLRILAGSHANNRRQKGKA